MRPKIAHAVAKPIAIPAAWAPRVGTSNQNRWASKPIWAHAGDSAFSAGYAIACAASHLAVTRTGGVGSVGVIAT